MPGGFLLNIRGLYLPNLVMHAGAALLPWLACLAVVGDPVRLALAAQGAAARRPGARSCRWPRWSCWSSASNASSFRRPRGSTSPAASRFRPSWWPCGPGSTIYATAFIAEIVRSSIEAVPKGQHEAARSLGLRPARVLFLIVLPQALRIMVPQLTSQYLNLIKSSTLGAAVAYPEFFQIFAGTVMNQSGKEVETILIVMAVFLTINLPSSAFMNWYNRRVALVER